MNPDPDPVTTAPSTPALLRFGIYELDLKNGELRKAGQRLKLQPQPFKVLTILAVRAGETVTREEIQHQVWGEELFVDFERGLNVCIQQIRGAPPRYIETLPKRGYRFLATVEKLENPVQTAHPPVASQQIAAVPSTHPKVKRLRLAVALVLVVLLISALLYFAKMSNRFPFRTAARSIRSVAVLPFDNFSGDPEQQYFADGMTEALIAELGQIRDLRVPSRTSVMLYKRAKKPLRQIAQELTVDALLEGSVTRSGDRVEITVQLLDGLRDQHLWGGTYARDFRDVLALQHELARAITAELKISFSPQEQQHLKSSAPVNADAYAAYLHGRYYWYKRTIEGFQKSIQYYEQAVAADPNYAPAYAGLADAYALLGSSPNDGLPPYEAMPKAKAAAQKALQLDDGLAEAHASLAQRKKNSNRPSNLILITPVHTNGTQNFSPPGDVKAKR